MSDTYKIRCPHCAGKIAIDRDYYTEIMGTAIECPHCDKQMIVPEQKGLPPIQPPLALPGTEHSKHSLDRTQEIQSVRPRPVTGFSSKSSDKQARLCPHCGAEVGKRDRICISCGNRLPPPEPPSGFSQIQV